MVFIKHQVAQTISVLIIKNISILKWSFWSILKYQVTVRTGVKAAEHSAVQSNKLHVKIK